MNAHCPYCSAIHVFESEYSTDVDYSRHCNSCNRTFRFKISIAVQKAKPAPTTSNESGTITCPYCRANHNTDECRLRRNQTALYTCACGETYSLRANTTYTAEPVLC